MNRSSSFYRNLWALTVLSFLRERPMHPYEMQRLIRERHKDDLLDLKPGSLYHAIDRLVRAGLIEPVETSREGKRPERTTYRATEEGTEELLDWLRDLLSRPSRDPNAFLAAVAHLPHLPPNEVADCLQMRAAHLEVELAALETVLRTLSPRIGRVVLLETDLARARAQAELAWVCDLIEDLRSGVYDWDVAYVLSHPGSIPGITHVPDDEAGESMNVNH